MAGVPPDRLDLPAGRDGLPAQHLLPAARAAGRPRRRPPAAPAGADRHRPGAGRARRAAGHHGARRRHRHRRLSRHRHADRHRQRLRDADAPDAAQGDGGGALPDDQRDCHERAGVQPRPHGGAGHRRRAARLCARGVVLRHQRAELRRHHRRAARHAPAAAPAPPASPASCPRGSPPAWPCSARSPPCAICCRP